jgi:hypothetical protein
MSRLEMEVEPILTPLILDTAAKLTNADLRVLAAWITLKSMILEYGNEDGAVSTQSEREFLMNWKMPPAGWRIWVARNEGKLSDAGFIRSAFTLGATFSFGAASLEGLKHTTVDNTLAKNTQSITFGIGKLIVHVLSSRDPRLQNIGPRTDEFPPVWKRVWPAPDFMTWATSLPIGDSVIHSVANALARYVDTLTWFPTPR